VNLRGQPHDDTARARWTQIDHVFAFGVFIQRGKKQQSNNEGTPGTCGFASSGNLQ
jgi:hypothetical protein